MRPRTRWPKIHAALILAGVLSLFVTGCNGKANPNAPSGYVAAHEEGFNAEAFIYKKFKECVTAEGRPELAQTADDLREAERRLIEAGKAGQPVPPGGFQPQPGTPTDPAMPQSRLPEWWHSRPMPYGNANPDGGRLLLLRPSTLPVTLVE
jgi:hypothetical protein